MNSNNLTDQELYELESLLKNKFQKFNFKPFEYNREQNIVIIKDQEFEQLLKLFYGNRYCKDENENIIISNYLFRLLEERYFKTNESIIIIDLILNKEKEISYLVAEQHILSMSHDTLKFDIDKKIIEVLNERGFKIRTDNNENYHSDLKIVAKKSFEILKEIEIKKEELNILKNHGKR